MLILRLVRVKFRHFHTVNTTQWKIQDSSVTRILREIKFEDSRRAKSAIYHI